MALSFEIRSEFKRAFRGSGNDNFNKTRLFGGEKKIGSINEFENETPNISMKYPDNQTEVLFTDLIPILEVKANTEKMLHGPSLNVFLLKTISTNAEKDKKRLYNVLNLWKKLTLALPDSLVPFQNIFYYSQLNSVQVCLNQTNLFPLKVNSAAIH